MRRHTVASVHIFAPVSAARFAALIRFLALRFLFIRLRFVRFAGGGFAGRTTFIGSLGFVGALIGCIVGVYAFQALFLPAGWPLTAGVPVWLTGNSFITVLLFGTSCGLGGAASGKLGLKRIERLTDRAPTMRRCLKCGAKVRMSARKCWAWRSYLPPT